MRAVLLAVTMCVGASATARAQGFTAPANPVVAAVQKIFDTESKNLRGAADLMPAEKYDYHPTPAQMTFGQLVSHVVQTNVAICSALTDRPSPLEPERLGKLPQVTDKVTLTPLLQQSFEYCGQALAGLNDAGLGAEAMMLGRATGMARAMALVTIATDWADHYSTAAIYLRLNDILPPSAQPRAR